MGDHADKGPRMENVMGKALVAFVLVIQLVAATALADTYIVCCRKIAMGGIDAFGKQSECTRCSTPLLNNEQAMSWTLCPDTGWSFGNDFNSMDGAWDWRSRVHNCPD